MRILFLTQYYPPEIGAPQNRLHELALRLKANGLDVEVLTAYPNYPKMEVFEAYQNGKIKEESIDGIKVYRSWIYVSKSKGILARLLNYFSFVFTAYFRGRKLKSYDYLLVESPPLFLGYTAMALSKKLHAKLIFNVSDLWPESAEKLGIVTNKFLLNFAYRLEARCYRKATLITGQTQGIVDNIKGRFREKDVYWLPNGVDLTFYNPATIESGTFRAKHGFTADQILFFYGGIIGHAQGLEVILKAAKLIENPKAVFIIQGAGPLLEELKQVLKKMQLTNVHFLPPVSKSEMPQVLKAVDVAVVPLKKLAIFEGAIPSKIFEAMSMEIPLLLGVDGEARRHFIEGANAGYFCEPEDENALAARVNELLDDPQKIKEMGKNGRLYVHEHFNRNKIAQDFYHKLKEIN